VKCEACERGDHENCGRQSWCECDCEGAVEPGDDLRPDERAALTVAWSQVQRGEFPMPACATVCVAALARLCSSQPRANLVTEPEPLVSALIQAVRMERDEFHERCNNSYSTDALMLAKERVALCKSALLAAMRGSAPCPLSGG
jgi:hypothetical protein